LSLNLNLVFPGHVSERSSKLLHIVFRSISSLPIFDFERLDAGVEVLQKVLELASVVVAVTKR
jgi:hypothetical protein